MTDFRVLLPEDVTEPQLIQELDWNRADRKWTVSEKESSLDRSWLQGLSPTHEQLRHLLTFFRVPSGYIGDKQLVSMSPGELVLAHQNTTNEASVYACLCSACGEHWYVFRKDEDLDRWKVYGRRCDWSWRRGDALNTSDLEMLEAIKKGQCDSD